MRHGFDEEYASEQFLEQLANAFYIYFDDKRHNTNGNPVTEEMKKSPKYSKNYQPINDWKIMKDRQKTISAVLVLCLNLGVDPPDIVKPYPCAKLEAWCDPSQFTDTKKAIEMMGKHLQAQFETISQRTRYKQSLDPCVEDVKRFCNTLRRNAKDERILFYYNGHGVPQPTASGEIWVFNRGYTQYIPISLYDLQNWLGAPVIFVYDCNSAGNIVHNFKKFVQKRIDDDNEGNHDKLAPSPTSAYLDCMQLAACKSNELLPMSPDLPADLFTCCLTCPIDISVRLFVMQNTLENNFYSQLPRNDAGNVDIPGKLSDRRTPLGELNWIFTAITDTIAWTTLSRPLFKRLFRQDLMLAALFRNLILAKRIMPQYNCNPISDPPLPDTVRTHHLWESWDLAMDQCCSQLLKMNTQSAQANVSTTEPIVKSFSTFAVPAMNGLVSTHSDINDLVNAAIPEHEPANPSTVTRSRSEPSINAAILNGYQHSAFFEQQLTAFELWLKYAGPSTKELPEQLPIVLQVLLSQVHRLRALILLSKFLDLGPWAVYLSLAVGTFPYVLKLLQSPAQELRPVLIFIWARIMAIDYKSSQQEFCKDKGYNYFYLIFNSNLQGQAVVAANLGAQGTTTPSSNILINDDHKAMCAFILTLFVKDFRNGQRLCFSSEIINNCLIFIQVSENPSLRQWCSLLLSQLWNKYPDGKWIIYKDGYLVKLLGLINDPIPEVRTSIIIALTTFLSENDSTSASQTASLLSPNGLTDSRSDELKLQDLKLANAVLLLMGDGSAMVRKELVYFLHKFVQTYIKFFLVVAFNQLEEEITLIDSPNTLNDFRKNSPAYGSIFSSIWKALLILSEDPQLEVKQLAETLIDLVMVKLNESELKSIVREMQEYLLSKSAVNISESFKPSKPIMGKHLVSADGKRQVSSASQLTRKNNMLAVGGPSSKTRSQSMTSSRSPAADHESGTDTESMTSKIKKYTLSKLFSTLRIPEDHDAKTFTSYLSYGPSQASYGSEQIPKPPFYKPRDLSKHPSLNAESGFFEYSCEYFQEPQMAKNQIDEPGSKEYVKRLWRRHRNEAIIQETQPQKELALVGDWNRNIKVLNNKTQAKIIKFTQFERVLAASDEKDNVSVWDWEDNKIVKKISNGNPFGTKITDLKFLNEDDSPLLMIGSSDGVIKIYKNFHTPQGPGDDDENAVELVSAWRALTDMLLTSKSSGLVTEWLQSRGSLLVSGDVKIIRVWDAPRELCLVDIPARSSSSITSLTSDQVSGNMIVAGFDDGSMRVYDRRLDSRESMVQKWPHNQTSPSADGFTGNGSIRNVRMQRGGFRELVSGSADGYVNLWDIRLSEPVQTFRVPQKSLRCMDVHEHAPVITTGAKSVDIWSTSGGLITTLVNPHDNYLTNRASSYLSSTVFHPHRMSIATNYNQDGYINVYSSTEIVAEY